MHSSYTKTRLGSFYRKDMATNRNHYTDPLDNNQIPPHQSLLPQVYHRMMLTPVGLVDYCIAFATAMVF